MRIKVKVKIKIKINQTPTDVKTNCEIKTLG